MSDRVIKEELSSFFRETDFHPVRANMEEDHYLGALKRAEDRMGELFEPNQVMGRRSTIGCVALEITQRCNLDCTLCYLSEHSEAVKDVPLEVIFSRIDNIKNHFAAGTNIQITGGDPTLRDRKELVSIVKYIKDCGMLPTLMTNGILATRDLVSELVSVGLNDIAFHVDLTQERKGFETELSLNKVRSEYIDRVRGLPIAVIFNTTVCKQNFQEIPDLIKYFRKNADVVGMASFQLQADTGRGVLRKRGDVISLQTVRDKIEKGAETKVSWDTVLIGHPKCHKIGITLEANGNLYDLNDDPAFFNAFLEDFRHLTLDRRYPVQAAWRLFKYVASHPKWFFKASYFVLRHAWKMKWDALKSGGKVHKLSFFVQNFMDATALDEERVHACSFMVMTDEGPVSMCAHNAQRDEFILKPIVVDSNTVWDPLTGTKKQKEVTQLSKQPELQS